MDNLFNRLIRKNMKFTENLHWGIYFRKGWVNAFAPPFTSRRLTWTYVVTHEESCGPYYTSKVLEEMVKQ